MTDLEATLALFERLGLPTQVDEVDDYANPRLKRLSICHAGGGDNPKVSGYGGFFTSWEFDLDGAFIEVGAWE